MFSGRGGELTMEKDKKVVRSSPYLSTRKDLETTQSIMKDRKRLAERHIREMEKCLKVVQKKVIQKAMNLSDMPESYSPTAARSSSFTARSRSGSRTRSQSHSGSAGSASRSWSHSKPRSHSLHDKHSRKRSYKDDDNWEEYRDDPGRKSDPGFNKPGYMKNPEREYMKISHSIDIQRTGRLKGTKKSAPTKESSALRKSSVIRKQPTGGKHVQLATDEEIEASIREVEIIEPSQGDGISVDDKEDAKDGEQENVDQSAAVTETGQEDGDGQETKDDIEESPAVENGSVTQPEIDVSTEGQGDVEKPTKDEAKPSAEEKPPEVENDDGTTKDSVPSAGVEVPYSLDDGRDVEKEYSMGDILEDNERHLQRTCVNTSDRQKCTLTLVKTTKMHEATNTRTAVALWKSCDHENIAKLRDSYETKDGVYFITDVPQNGEKLSHAIDNHTIKDERHCARIISDVCTALFYLHARGIVHCDVRPSNILLTTREDGTMTSLLTHFENAAEVGHVIATVLASSSDVFVAPEMNQRNPSIAHIPNTTVGTEVDIWGLGVLAYTLLLGFEPCHPDQFDHNQWDHVTESSKHLIESMLLEESKDRISAAEVLCHPWILGADHGDSIEELRVARRLELDALAQQLGAG